MLRFDSERQLCHFSFRCCSPALRLCLEGVRSFHRRTEATPTSRRQKGPTPLRISPLALATQEWVGFPSLRTAPATTTPVLALEHSHSTMQTKIRPLALLRSYSIPTVPETQPLE